MVHLLKFQSESPYILIHIKGPSVQEGPFVIYENKNWVR